MSAVLGDPRLDALLHAVVDRMVPADDLPSGWDSGVGDFLRGILAREQAPRLGELRAGLHLLDAEEEGGFLALVAEEQDALLARLERGETARAWPTSPVAFVALLAALCAQGYYGDPGNGGNRDAVSWTSLGYAELAAGRTWPAREPAPGPTITLDGLRDRYDVIVVGAGAGGCIAAQVLAEGGSTVLLVERGAAWSSDDLPLDQLRSERSWTGYPTRTGPAPVGDPRVHAGSDGSEVVLAPSGAWSANAFAVGGGTRVYGAQAWRFAPLDFRMATTYGVPEGSGLADWPIDYDDLEPWYDRCEWEYGVNGDDRPVSFAGERRRGYPMPPLPETRSTRVLRAGAGPLGLTTAAVPLLINSVPYNGRPACVQCGTCVGFACHAAAKNGGQNTALPRALATGRCDLLPLVQAERLLHDDDAVVGVALVTEEGGEARRVQVAAARVVVAAGAIETARLLLNSPTPAESTGIGNAHDLVGRHLQSHVYAGAIGFFDEVVQDGLGPGPNIATNDFRHGNDGIVGGGMIANDFVPTPVTVWDTLTRTGVLPRWGLEAKRGMRELWSRMQMVFGPAQEVPNPAARVTVDPAVLDRFGVPVARLSGDIHPEDRRTARMLADRAADWLEASGARRVVRMTADERPEGPSGGQHQAGTCRMGTTPETGVTDPWGRVWGHPELLIADGSVHVTNGGVNPVLTIMALAYRNSSRFAEADLAG
jgi:choline dehydrogenase-like flavoprotein